jgi:hypothetical protein
LWLQVIVKQISNVVPNCILLSEEWMGSLIIAHKSEHILCTYLLKTVGLVLYSGSAYIWINIVFTTSKKIYPRRSGKQESTYRVSKTVLSFGSNIIYPNDDILWFFSHLAFELPTNQPQPFLPYHFHITIHNNDLVSCDNK